ncbi:MAG: hypothetical protein HC834_09205 [Rhodospirillales bacterium]|nr:hypothetical protein [Rhodospirillales bacterium]
MRRDNNIFAGKRAVSTHPTPDLIIEAADHGVGSSEQKVRPIWICMSRLGPSINGFDDRLTPIDSLNDATPRLEPVESGFDFAAAEAFDDAAIVLPFRVQAVIGNAGVTAHCRRRVVQDSANTENRS